MRHRDFTEPPGVPLGRTDTRNRSTTNSRLTWEIRTASKTLGELVAEICTLWDYNNTRIHSALNMPPVVFPNGMR